MDTKLKALKVVDLKQILAAAKVSVPAKATKGDLIAKIQSSKPALDAYAVRHPPDDLLAPPEEVDWGVEQPEVAPPAPVPILTTPPSTKPTSAPVKAVPVPSTTTETPATAAPTDDPELERRKRRAERFGIPLVETKQKNATQPQKSASGVSSQQLDARAKRFGNDDPKPNGKKRPAQAEDADPEESERRKKRSERFGLPVKT